MPDIDTYRASGWWELYHVRCNDCGWKSRPIDPILNKPEWRQAKAHRCDED